MKVAIFAFVGIAVISLIYYFMINFSLVFFSSNLLSFLAYQVKRLSISISINCFFLGNSSLDVATFRFSSVGNLFMHSMSDGNVSNRLLFNYVWFFFSLSFALLVNRLKDRFSGIAASIGGRVVTLLKL